MSSHVAAHFSREADYWDAVYRDAQDDVSASIYQERLARMLAWVDRLDLPPGSRALDLGTGAGHAAVALALRGWHVEAIDVSEAMAALAQANADRAGVGARVRCAPGDAQALALADASLDLVVGLGVLPWVPSATTVMRDVARVLRPGACAIVSTANRARLTYRLDPLRNQDLRAVKRPLRALLERRGLWRAQAAEPTLLSLRETDQLLADNGFERLAWACFGFGPFTFLGRPILSRRTDVQLNRRLQRVAALRRLGSEYLVLARRRG